MISITMRPNCGYHSNRIGSNRTPPRGVANEHISVPIHDREAELETKRRAVRLARETSKVRLLLAKQTRDRTVQTKVAAVKAIKTTLNQAKIVQTKANKIRGMRGRNKVGGISINKVNIKVKIAQPTPIRVNEAAIRTENILPIELEPINNIETIIARTNEVSTRPQAIEIEIILAKPEVKLSEVDIITSPTRAYDIKRLERMESFKREQADRIARIRNRANACVERSEHMRLQELERNTHIRECIGVIQGERNNAKQTIVNVVVEPTVTPETMIPPQLHHNKTLIPLCDIPLLLPSNLEVTLNAMSTSTNLTSKRRVRAKLKPVRLSWKRVRLRQPP